MLRLMGAVLIIGGSTGIGLLYRRNLRQGLMQLLQMKKILELFVSEIRFGKANLPECCRQVARNAEEPYREALLGVYGEMEKQERSGFAESFGRQMGEAVRDLPVTAEEKRIFLDFAQCSCLADWQMQVRAIEQCRDMLDSKIKMRESCLAKQERLATGLGVMSGLLLAIILL